VGLIWVWPWENIEDITDENSGSLVQADIYPYIKLGIPTNPVRFSLKFSMGGGFTIQTHYLHLLPSLGAYIDLLVGAGNPEFLTVGLRLAFPKETPLMLILSSHHSSFTLSFMLGYFADRYDRVLNAYFGIGKAF